MAREAGGAHRHVSAVALSVTTRGASRAADPRSPTRTDPELRRDLHYRDVGESGVDVVPHALCEFVEVGATRDRSDHVVGANELGCCGEPCGRRQVGADRPAAPEPAELLVRARWRCSGQDPESLDALVHPAGGDPSEVAFRGDSDQRGLGAFAACEQPFWEVGALAKFRDGDVDCLDTRIEVAVPLPVSLRSAVGAGISHSAPTTACASADSSALIVVCSRLLIRSGDASVRASASTFAG